MSKASSTLTRRAVLAAPAVLLIRPAAAQAAWPTHPVRFISSSPPAGASDILTRTIANELQQQLVSTNWFGIAGPAGTPEPIVTKLHAEIVKALATQSVKDRLTNIGVEPGGDTPDATQAFVLAEIERWAKVVRQTGTTIN